MSSGWRKREGGRGRGCERIHAVEFCILSLAACGLKQHPLPTTTGNPHYAKELTRDRETERDTEQGKRRWRGCVTGGRSLFLLAAFIGGLSARGKKSEGARACENWKKTRGKREKKRKDEGKIEKENERGERVNPVIFFPVPILTGG